MRVEFIAVAIVIAAATGTACSSSSKSSSGSSATTTTTVSKQPVCAARANLEQSVKALTSPSLLTSGKSGIQSAVDTIKQNLDAVSSASHDVYKPQVDAVKSAVDDVGTALSGFGTGNTSANLQAIGNAITKVGSTSATLASSLQTACPS